ncbi:7252_t:CDS:1, partial [Gigaspora rosea]
SVSRNGICMGWSKGTLFFSSLMFGMLLIVGFWCATKSDKKAIGVL